MPLISIRESTKLTRLPALPSLFVPKYILAILLASSWNSLNWLIATSPTTLPANTSATPLLKLTFGPPSVLVIVLASAATGCITKPMAVTALTIFCAAESFAIALKLSLSALRKNLRLTFILVSLLINAYPICIKKQ